MKPLVIIPAAGKSSRFRGKKPKWLRTHPDGNLMLRHAIKTFDEFDVDIVLVTTKAISEEFDVQHLLKDGCPELHDILTLDGSTDSAIDTVQLGLQKLGSFAAQRPLFVKDSDNFVLMDRSKVDMGRSFTVGCNIYEHKINSLTNKSFLVLNEFEYVTDFIEKKVISDTISVGTHYFESTELFSKLADVVLGITSGGYIGEKYLSHLIAYGIYNGVDFKHVGCVDYIDFGTQEEWNRIQDDFKVIFSDFDGTLVYNKGRFGQNNWFERNDRPIIENIEILAANFKRGSQIIITTSRCQSERDYIITFLKSFGVCVKDVICDCHHSPRVLINDYADTNPYPSSRSINLPRDGQLSHFLN